MHWFKSYAKKYPSVTLCPDIFTWLWISKWP